MSQENVELVESAFHAFNQDGVEGLLPYLDPDIEWTTTGGYVEPATYRGHEGVRNYLGSMADEFEGFRNDPEEFIEVGPQVVVSTRISGRGKRSGAPVELSLAAVCSLRGQKIVRMHNYSEKSAALEAAGLSE